MDIEVKKQMEYTETTTKTLHAPLNGLSLSLP